MFVGRYVLDWQMPEPKAAFAQLKNEWQWVGPMRNQSQLIEFSSIGVGFGDGISSSAVGP